MRYYTADMPKEHAFDAPKGADEHDEWTAEMCAEEYHNSHDGWEDSWPVTIILIDESGESRWSIDREMEPFFSATEDTTDE